MERLNPRNVSRMSATSSALSSLGVRTVDPELFGVEAVKAPVVVVAVSFFSSSASFEYRFGSALVHLGGDEDISTMGRDCVGGTSGASSSAEFDLLFRVNTGLGRESGEGLTSWMATPLRVGLGAVSRG